MAGKEQPEPRTLSKALSGPEAQKWKEAANEEYSSLIKNGTWKLTTLPQNRKAISNRWIFKRKYDQDGNISRYKARLVVRGFSQIAGLDYLETFAPVIKFTTVRIVLALVAQLDLECHQMDVKTAYLNGEVEEELYMEQPVGFVQKGQEDLVCKLEKSLYGLKRVQRTGIQNLIRYSKSLDSYSPKPIPTCTSTDKKISFCTY